MLLLGARLAHLANRDEKRTDSCCIQAWRHALGSHINGLPASCSLQKFSKFFPPMARLHGSDTAAQINIATDPNILLEIYRDNTAYLQEVVSKLLSLREYDHFAIVWGEALPRLSKDYVTLLIVLNKIKMNAKEICQAGKTDFFVRTLLDLTMAYPKAFETVRICQTISELIIQNKCFPSKATAILYFQTIADLFKIAGSFLSYLNALHLLNDLESLTVASKELSLMREMAKMQSEAFAKDLFCGIKPKDVDAVTVGVVDAECECDDRAVYILNGLKSEEGLENTVANVSFLLRHLIAFKSEQGRLRAAKPANKSFTSLIFSIAKQYEPAALLDDEVEVEVVKPVEKKQAPQRPKEEAPRETKPKVEFKNRFTVPYKRSKLIRQYMEVSFADTHYDERCKRRDELNLARREERERERAFLLPHSETVDDLLLKLKELQEERANAERQVLLEKAKADEEQLLAERRDNMWRSEKNLKKAVSAAVAENRSSVNLTGDSQGREIYVPNLPLLNMTMANLRNPRSEPKPSEPESWRRKKTTPKTE